MADSGAEADADADAEDETAGSDAGAPEAVDVDRSADDGRDPGESEQSDRDPTGGSDPGDAGGTGDDPRVVGLDSDDADDVLDALASETARSVLARLREEPATPSEVADRVDTSLQNAQYHLDSLREADVVEVVDTATSQKGREMDVYAPTGEPVVVLTGDEDEASGLRAALARLVGGLAAVAVASLVVQWLFGGAGGSGGDTGGGPTIADAPAPDPGPVVPPGLVFFAGGTLALLAVLAVWYHDRR